MFVCVVVIVCVSVLFFKQKTAYEVRISDWSSDVCSSDLAIVGIGETAAQRESGEAIEGVRAQVRGSVPADATPDSIVLAYEPVWAIGTGKVARPEDVAEMHAAIRAQMRDLLPDGEDVRIQIGRAHV